MARATGGLIDTVTDTSQQTLSAATATGFTFREYEGLALAETLRRAIDAWHVPGLWSQVVANGMRKDWSWRRSAAQYVELYQSVLKRNRESSGGQAAGG